MATKDSLAMYMNMSQSHGEHQPISYGNFQLS